MKRIRYINPWYFALIFTQVYSAFIFYLFARLHPKGTPSDWQSFFFFTGAGSGTLFLIYISYRIIRKKEGKIPVGLFYGLLFLLSFLLFPVFYGLYYGVLVNRVIYRGGASITLIFNEAKTMIGVFQVPICFAVILGLYNKKVFQLNQDIIEKENMLSEARLVQLQQQVDPHFLFNNLNILSALIRQSPEQAELFSQKLSELYRYHLRSGKQQLVTLTGELQYMQDYLYLLKCRFGEAFPLRMFTTATISNDALFIITGTLQLLLENVVKHNAASLQQPVTIRISINNEELIIENKVYPREAVSEGIGLKNLEHRYQILTGKKIVYGITNGIFRVQVPLIKQLKLPGA
ncbi:sensor histidine kinase [Niabella beijingensis]|uniref:sensor histidine kinase n=1 Tax=Niabella beijingensis TaxID=2872700 RepID=UPI001CBDD288|nr:histidine kinase [Niabella beijingensis]MBZ4189429.1 histidine kinase [Niabella beijingensis]